MTQKKPVAKMSPKTGNPTPVVDDVPSPSTIAKILAEWRWLLIAVMFAVSFVGQHVGWWSAEQGQQIRDVIPVGAESDGNAVAAIAPDVQALIDSLKAKLDELTSKLDDENEPDPQPDPQPTSLAIHIHDKTGQLLTDPTIDAGQLIRVSSVGSVGPIEWLIVPSGTVDMSLSTDRREYAGTLRTTGDWCQFVLIDWGSKSAVSIRITCNKGPQPPPPPSPDPDPEPEPDPPTPTPVTSFRVIFVAESGETLPPSQTGIPESRAVREYLFAKTTRDGETTGWRQYDPQVNATNEQPTIKALWEQVKPKLTVIPCVVIEVNGKAEILPYPANAADALALLKKYGG